MSEFGSLDLEDMAGEAARLNENNDRRESNVIPLIKPKPGATNLMPVRILPPVKGAKLFQYTRLHMITGKDEDGQPVGKPRSVHCPKPLVNGKWDRNTPCPICEYYHSLWKEIERLESKGRDKEAEDLKEEARSIKPIERYYYNAIARSITDEAGNKQTNVGPMILSIGKTVHKMILRAIMGEENEPALGDVTHPKKGYDFLIRIENRGGKENYPNYDRSAFARESSPLGTPEEIKKWASTLHDLTELRVLKNVEELERELARHRGLIQDNESSFNVEEFDKKYGRSNNKAAKPAVSEEDAVNAVVQNSEEFDEFEGVTPPETPASNADIAIDDEEFLKEFSSVIEEN